MPNTAFRRCKKTGAYSAQKCITEDQIISMANTLVRRRFKRGRIISSPSDTKAYLASQLSSLEHEVFGVIFLSTRHSILAFEQMFRGTIDGTSVYPREVAKQALAHNAAAVIFVHNHPSGNPAPSEADKRITQQLVNALKLFEINVLDHIIVAGGKTLSFAEHGLL